MMERKICNKFGDSGINKRRPHLFMINKRALPSNTINFYGTFTPLPPFKYQMVNNKIIKTKLIQPEKKTILKTLKEFKKSMKMWKIVK